MKKIILILSLMVALVFQVNDIHAQDVDLTSENVIAFSLNDHQVLYEKNSDDIIYPASMTKIMTALVAIENIDNFEKEHMITYKDTEGLFEANASVAGFYVNQVVTLKDLIYGSLLPSGADATQALANELFGSQEKFVEKMNEKAEELGLENTHFVNTSGLHEDNHYSTVNDIASLLVYALQNETFKEVFCTSSYEISDGSMTIYSTKLNYLNSYPMDTSFILGSKTGYTGQAGLCLAMLGLLNDEPYIMVSAQTYSNSDYPYNFEDAINLNAYLTSKYENRNIIEENKALPINVNVKYGNIDQINIISNETIKYFFEKERESQISYEFLLDEGFGGELKAPLSKDTYLGYVNLYDNGSLIKTSDIYLHEDIEENKFGYYFRHPMIFFKEILIIPIMILFIICLLLVIVRNVNKRKKRINKKRRVR